MAKLRKLFNYDLSLIQTRSLQFSEDGRKKEVVFKAKLPGTKIPEVTGRTEREAISNLLDVVNNRVKNNARQTRV